ncbi:VOC family protein [Lunatibacter salilacus]|uniref:VOC family protein n=1 Tax=Lunatibacter salilacus TaxID=2483804 RepID=UPI00131B91C2|nr:VOC family protein [Lunatibacter salilacus]
MRAPIQPYLHFQDNCREAMDFYQGLFGGNLELMPIGQSPAKDQFPEKLHNQIMHASLSNGDFNIMASDMCGQGELKRGNAVQLNLNCATEEEIRELYQKLSQNGKIIEELKEQFWGALFAMVIDKFGVRWMLSFDKSENEAA